MNDKPICLIPARSGSKRIKNKNIKHFAGKPLIGHVIKIAKKSNIFSRIIVSTDSKKIAKIAKYYGAEILSLSANTCYRLAMFLIHSPRSRWCGM